MIVANEILSGEFVSFIRYGDLSVICFSKEDDLTVRRWRRTRRAAREGFTKPVVRNYHPILRKEAILLASALLLKPEAREKHFQRCVASATMSILYDYPTLKTENDKSLKQIHAFTDRVSEAASPGAHLVELFPWMMHIPDWSVLIFIGRFPQSASCNITRLAKWKREGKNYFEQHRRMYETLFDNVRQEIVGEHAENLYLKIHHSLKGSKGRVSVRS